MTTHTNQPNPSPPIRVMLVDDSAVIRGFLTRILEKESDIEIVSSLTNGEMAVNALARVKPDLVVMDIEMPIMDGITALPKLLEIDPGAKIIICSSLSRQNAEISIKALALGAADCILKPSSREEIANSDSFSAQLLRMVRNIAKSRAKVAPQVPPASVRTGGPPPVSKEHVVSKPGAAAAQFTLHKSSHTFSGKPSILAIGSSTGGPKALQEVIAHLKDIDVPIVITQHMPATFTAILAGHIQSVSGLPSCEGETDMPVQKGHVYVAPGGKHMLIELKDGVPVIKLNDGPQENFCKPAVDPMFRSLLNVYGNKILSVILTGMGQDGLKGAEMLVNAGAPLIAQDQKTSVVWGMPGAVAMAGLCTDVLPLQDIAPWIRNRLHLS